MGTTDALDEVATLLKAAALAEDVHERRALEAEARIRVARASSAEQVATVRLGVRMCGAQRCQP